MQYLACQEFEPVERAGDGRCIWCTRSGPKNNAHIISRKLTEALPRDSLTLRKNVCRNCNTTLSKLEQWVLRNSPLAWSRFFTYPVANQGGSSREVPSYFFSSEFEQWLVFHLEAISRSYHVLPQLLGFPEEAPIFVTGTSNPEQDLNEIYAALCSGSYLQDTSRDLPADFASRAILDGNRVILIGIDDRALDNVRNLRRELMHVATKERILSGNTGRVRHHFRWSKANWARFATKTAFELLCLLEGPAHCMDSAYDQVRRFALEAPSQGRELTFDESGPLGVSDVPQSVSVDISNGQNCPRYFQALTSHGEAAMHSVSLYEMSGWVIASVSFSGFPPCTLVLAGPGQHLSDLYHMVYDDVEAKFHFTRLANDPNEPVIPMPLHGDLLTVLQETYKLIGH